MDSTLRITLKDKLMVIPILFTSIAAALIRLITYPFSGGPKANTLLKDVLFAGLRTYLSIVSPATEQWMNPTTESNYLQFTKKHGFQPDTDVLRSGVKLFWIGPKNADNIILYCHGGGYSLSCSPGHFDWLFNLRNELAKSNSISVVLIGYTLAPYGQYPVQLKQAAESLSWLLDTKNKKPGNIVLAGDSAGGNMALSLISHLQHPHPEVPDKIELKEPLAGAILISPWAKFGTDDQSVRRNKTSDMVTAQAAHRWSKNFLGSRPHDKYNQPILGDAKWWNGLSLVVKEILIWGGSYEILIDSIQSLGNELQKSNSRTELVVQPGASHEDFIIDSLLGYKKGEGTKAIESWISARL